MNIDNSNLLSVVSPVEGLDALQSALPSDSALSNDTVAFSETLAQKINQLEGLSLSNYATEGLATENIESGNVLPQIADLVNSAENNQQNIAGLLADDETATGLSSFFDTGLSQAGKLGTEIDLENTLDTLANVLSSLENEKDDLGEEMLALGAQVAVEIESFESKMPKAISLPLNQQQDIEVSVDGVDEFITDVDMENHIGSPMTTVSEFQAVEKGTVTLPVNQELKTGLNKENASLKQMVDDRTLSAGIPNKSDAEIPLQKNTSLTEAGQKNIAPMLVNKQNQRVNVLETKVKDLDLGTEKAVPKFAMDIANLNRAVISENKTEIQPMTKHFAHPEWNKEVGERVIFMHKQAIPSAELRLNPQHLGPITIKVETTQDQVSVAFTAQHAAVKEAIDAALPKLREMLTAQQLNLSEVSVSQEDARQKQQQGFSQMGSDTGKGEKQANEMAENGQTESAMDIADEIEAGRAIASNGVLSIFA